MIYGIVGAEEAKFTPETESDAKTLLIRLISDPRCTGVASGECHLGGIDIWAKIVCLELDKPYYPFPPRHLDWNTGFKPRNIRIALKSDEIHNIVLAQYPPDFKGRRFDQCYHCNSTTHVKSGGCWTAIYAREHGRKAVWYIL